MLSSPTNDGHKRASRLLQEKAKEIQALLDQPEVDLWKLRGLAITEGGLLNGTPEFVGTFKFSHEQQKLLIFFADVIRKRAWPKLAGIHQRFWDEQEPTSQPKSCEASDTTPKRSNSRQRCQGADATPIVRPLPPAPKRLRERNDSSNSITSSTSLRDRILASSLDARQIELDVTRCTWHLLTGTQRAQRIQMEETKGRNKKILRLIRRKQRRLSNLINLTLVQSYRNNKSTQRNNKQKDNTLRYYQGYHDVACIFLSTLSGSAPVPLSHLAPSASLEAVAIASGLDLPAAVLLQISQAHLRDSMRANFTHLQTSLRLILFPLLAYFDPDVQYVVGYNLHCPAPLFLTCSFPFFHTSEHLAMCEMEPFFALSWVITWFAHEIRDTELTKRLFDFFLVSHPLMPLYVSVAMITHPLNRQDVLQTECDFALVHQTLAALPRNSSMVGWKYQPGDGYVSDDEEDLDDDDASSFGMSSQSSVDTEFLLQEETKRAASLMTNELSAEAVSIVSSSMSTFSDARVPFQELIDTALSFMQRMPPRNLTQLAKRYYGSSFVHDALSKAPEVFRDPPAWTLSATAQSDRMLKLNATKQQSREPLDAAELSPLLSSSSYTSGSNGAPLLTFPDRIRSAAAIAAGVAPGDDAERRRNRKKRLFWAGAVVVAVVAVVVGVVLSPSRKQRDASPQPQILMATSAMVEPAVEAVVLPAIQEDRARSSTQSSESPTFSFVRRESDDGIPAGVLEVPKVDQLVSGLLTFLMQQMLLTKFLHPLKELQRASQNWRQVIRRRLFNKKRGVPQLPSQKKDEEPRCSWSAYSFFDDILTTPRQGAVCWDRSTLQQPMQRQTSPIHAQFFAQHSDHPILRGFTDLASHLQRLPLHKLVNFVEDRKQELSKISLTAVQSAISEASVSAQYDKATSSREETSLP